MLKTRVLTAVFALSLLAFIFVFGNANVMRVFFTILVFLGTWEISSMVLPRLHKQLGKGSLDMPSWWPPITGFIASVTYVGTVFIESIGISGLMPGMLSLLILGVFLIDDTDLSFVHSSASILCLVYGAIPWIAIWNLYLLSTDFKFIYFVCTIVWSGDSGAYFVGRKFGKRKLAPRLSPNKTWEGAIGGLISSVFGGLLIKLLFDPGFVALWEVLACSILGGVFGQIGDLTESAFKRFAGVKDSGRIFPGHGGFLDRVDGLLFAAPVIWLILCHYGTHPK